MRKRIVLFVVIGLVGFDWALTAAAMPKWMADQIVDSIMNWGDKHIGGPFKKGGGDEAVTREVVSLIVEPQKAGKVIVDLSFRGSSTATPAQDTPGYSQQHGTPVPSGTHKQVAIGQPPTPQAPNQTPQNQPSISINPEIHPVDTAPVNHSMDTAAPLTTQRPDRNIQASGAGPLSGDHTHADNAATGGTSSSGAGNHASSGNSSGTAQNPPSPQTWLRAGETPLADASNQPTIEINQNRDLATGTSNGSPSDAPRPAATPTAPATTTPSPAATPNAPPAARSGGSSSEPSKGMIEKSVIPSMPHDVGVTSHEPGGGRAGGNGGGGGGNGGGGGGGGRGGGWTGPDHGSAGNIS
jgi:hypothetical protein